MTHPLLFAAFFLVGYMLVWYVIAQVRHDNSVVDVGWGLGFVLLCWALYLRHPGYPWWVCVAVSLWGLRLAFHIGRRNLAHGEDWRYRRWRAEWGGRAAWMAFWKVFALQGVFLWVVAWPLITLALRDPSTPVRGLWLGVGAVLWLVGWLWESVADAQLAAFKANPANKGQVMRRGLWQYSRHPNYFGEIVLWWGIFALAWASGAPWWSALGPAILTWLLLRVSGVPMLEAKYEGRPDYQAYVREVRAVFPRFWR